MGDNLARKLIAAHLLVGRLQIGEEIGIRIDQTTSTICRNTPAA
jgi:hypothetical protein